MWNDPRNIKEENFSWAKDEEQHMHYRQSYDDWKCLCYEVMFKCYRQKAAKRDN